jgi:hypothetical protein
MVSLSAVLEDVARGTFVIPRAHSVTREFELASCVSRCGFVRSRKPRRSSCLANTCQRERGLRSVDQLRTGFVTGRVSIKGGVPCDGLSETH